MKSVFNSEVPLLPLDENDESRERLLNPRFTAVMAMNEEPLQPCEDVDASRAPDGSDGRSTPLSISRPSNGAAKTTDEKTNIDSLVDDHGPLFIVGKKTTQGNQIAIASKFANDYQIRFDPELASFVQYNTASGLWETKKDPNVNVTLAKFIKTQAEKNEATDFIPKRTNAFLGAVLGLLKGFTLGVDKERLRRIIHVGNGMLALSVNSPVLLKFDPSFFSRRACGVEYKAGTQCPRFVTELLKPSMSDDDIDLLQRFCGATLMGDNAAQRFLIASGDAARGKSTAVTLLERIIGVENVAHLRTEHLPGRFESHAFLNKLLLTAKDVPGDFLARRGAQMIKALVGDDLIESEQKYGGKFRMRGNFNVVVTSNNRLRLAMEDDEPAWRRRLIVIRFEGQQPVKRIANFGEILLREEGEGILAWMVRGAIKHLEELDDTGDFVLTEDQKTRIDDLLEESKSPAVFISSRVTKQIGADVTVDELKEAYLEFCKVKHWESFSIRQFENVLADVMQKFHGVLRRNDITRGGKSLRGFKHVALINRVKQWCV